MTDMPEDWVLIEAGNRSGWIQFSVDNLRDKHAADIGGPFRALCNMIQKYEQPPVDRKVLCAEKALREWDGIELIPTQDFAIRAIELWEEGYGK